MSRQPWDDKTKTGSPDNDLISLTEPYEVEYWCKKLGVDADTLRNLVDVFGHSAAVIRGYLSMTFEEQTEVLKNLQKRNNES